MPTKWYHGHVIKILDESPTTKRFWLKIDGEDNFKFKAGQFITIDLPIAEKRLGRWRSYSIANPPDDTNIIELCIVRLDDGSATQYLFEDVEVGSVLKFKGPDGNFCLPDTIDFDIVFLCTGTGVAPFRSMIFDLINADKDFKNLHLIFGTRFKTGILYEEEFMNLAQTQEKFDFDIALSREEEDLKNGMHKGYIHPIYMNAYSEVRDDVKFYICGWSGMIDEAVANLLVKLGYNNNQIKYELYG